MRDALINNFLRISSIPRITGNEKIISDFFIEVAKKNNLEYYQDEYNNVLIRKNSTGKPYIAFQAHLDMVGVKTSDSTHDFNTDGIEVIINGDTVTAKDTTLGADQGVGLAIMLTMIEDSSISNVEFLFTTEEETTYNGVINFPYDKVISRKILNLDGANDDTIIIGSTGDIVNKYSYKKDLVKSDLPCYKITISGLKGGNSGENIELSKNNAIITLVKKLKDKKVLIRSISGGIFENDIASDCEIVLKTSEDINSMFDGFNIEMVNEEYAFSQEDSNNIISEILELESGYITENISGNLGMIRTNDNEIVITYLLRGMNYEELNLMNNRLINLNNGFTCNEEYRDSIWKPDYNSELLNEYKELYFSKYNEYPKEIISMCGLECGVMKNNINNLDIISIGANIKYYHTINEVTYINSWEKIYNLLIELLK